MSSRVPLEVKCVIESLSAEGAEIPLDVAVALHVPVEEALEAEHLGTHTALELGGVCVWPHGREALLQPHQLRGISC